jgi:hypothetical protein
MNIKTELTRPIATALGIALLGFVLTANAVAGNYRVRIKKISPESASGDVIIKIKPGTKEKGFSGTASVMLSGTDPGTNRAMATLLTAVSLGADVIIDVPDPPSYDNIQIITSLSILAP